MIIEKATYDEHHLEHYGKKGMRWGVRNESRTSGNSRGSASGDDQWDYRKGSEGTSRATKGIYRKTDKTQSRAMRNGKRVVSFLLGGPPGLIAYNSISAPLNKKSSRQQKTQSRIARNGKVVVATLLTTPLGGYAYYQMAAKIKK